MRKQRANNDVGKLREAWSQMAQQHRQAEEDSRKHREHLEALVQARIKMLQENEAFNKRILELSITDIYIYDLKKACNIYINPQYTKLLGHTLDVINDFDAEEFFALFHPDDQPRIATHIEEITRAGSGDNNARGHHHAQADGKREGKTPE